MRASARVELLHARSLVDSVGTVALLEVPIWVGTRCLAFAVGFPLNTDCHCRLSSSGTQYAALALLGDSRRSLLLGGSRHFRSLVVSLGQARGDT